MPIKKKYLALSAALIAAVLIALFFWTRLHGAPDSVRLLPDSDAVAYANLTPLRLANVFTSLKKVSHNPDYEDFIQQSGVDFERDLSEVAVAIHLPSPASTTAAPTAPPPPHPEPRFSWIFKGNFDSSRLGTYLRKISRSTEIYSGKEIFTVPVENRLVRAVVLRGDQVAVSNVDDPRVIHQMIDHASSWLLPAGPALAREHYKDVPFGSLVWAIARQTSKDNSSALNLPGGFDVSLPADTTWVLSLRYAGSINLKAQALTASEEDARKVADTLGTLLSLFRSVQTNMGAQGPDPDVKNLFDSLQVTQEGNRTIITAEISIGFIKKMAQQAPSAMAEKPTGSEPVIPEKKK
jgi:hypothetical protein